MKLRVILIIGISLFYGCATIPNDEMRYFVVDSVVAAKRLESAELGENIFPWEKLQYQKELEPGEIVISNSCGFARFIYEGVDLSGFPESEEDWESPSRFEALFHLGEWCRLGDALFEHSTLLLVRYWRAQAYVIDSADIHWTDEYKAYIVDTAFIESEGLKGLYKDVPNHSGASSCWEKKNTPPKRYSILADRPNTTEQGDVVCFSKGVFLEDISMQPLNQSSNMGAEGASS